MAAATLEDGGCLTSTLRVVGEYSLATFGKTPLPHANKKGEGRVGEYSPATGEEGR